MILFQQFTDPTVTTTKIFIIYINIYAQSAGITNVNNFINIA